MDYIKENNSSPDLKIFLIGNKSDLEESRLVTKEQGIKFKEENNLHFFTETSAKSEKDAQEIFIEAVKVLYNDYLESKKSEAIPQFQFNYNYYISDDNKKLLILIEIPGIITDIQISGSKEDNKYTILYKGKKCLSEEEKFHMKLVKNVGRQFGEFIMEIPIVLNEYEIVNLEEPNHYDKNGIEYIEYNITKISEQNLEKNN